ncbi:MAG: phosphomannomutase/phosphoglucomutase [Selenomonadaceae bacterium]|nr:phosphomannomutase/phosphoglucomutase [Selenomonadaceae bacterium]
MKLKDFFKLQNGSDIRGVAVPSENSIATLLPEIVFAVTSAFVTFLSWKLKKPTKHLSVAVGHDSRISAAALKKAALAAVSSQKSFPLDAELASTPAMFMATKFDAINADGGIMLTASHLPADRNGIKFFTKDGGLEKEDIKEILKLAAYDDSDPNFSDMERTLTFEKYGNAKKTIEDFDVDSVSKIPLMEIYTRSLREKIISEIEDYEPLKGLHIVVDAGNGAGGFFAKKVLSPLGADISGSIFLDPDGNFPNHIPNPENEEAIVSIQNAVKTSDADLGIIFDTDVDRMSAVLKGGKTVNRNALIAMMSAIVAKDYPESVIVTDSVTSDELSDFLKKIGLKHLRYKRGYKNVINKCKELNENGEISPLAIETSGHGALSENYFLDDGAYLAVKLIIAAARERHFKRELADLIKDLKYPKEEREIRIKINAEDFKTYGDNIIKTLFEDVKEAGLSVDDMCYEGIRVKFEYGFFLLRMSLHDPLLVLNIESRKEGGGGEIFDKVKQLLNKFDKLDEVKLT